MATFTFYSLLKLWFFKAWSQTCWLWVAGSSIWSWVQWSSNSGPASQGFRALYLQRLLRREASGRFLLELQSSCKWAVWPTPCTPSPAGAWTCFPLQCLLVSLGPWTNSQLLSSNKEEPHRGVGEEVQSEEQGEGPVIATQGGIFQQRNLYSRRNYDAHYWWNSHSGYSGKGEGQTSS